MAAPRRAKTAGAPKPNCPPHRLPRFFSFISNGFFFGHASAGVRTVKTSTLGSVSIETASEDLIYPIQEIINLLKSSLQPQFYCKTYCCYNCFLVRLHGHCKCLQVPKIWYDIVDTCKNAYKLFVSITNSYKIHSYKAEASE